MGKPSFPHFTREKSERFPGVCERAPSNLFWIDSTGRGIYVSLSLSLFLSLSLSLSLHARKSIYVL